MINPVNEIVRLQMMLKASGQQKRGRPPVFNSNMFYPRALENDLLDATKAELTRIFEENMKLALTGLRDDLADLNASAVVLSPEFIEKTGVIAQRVNENAGQTFQKQVDMIIGRPYYPPTAQREILEAWHDEFQTLCISAGQDGKKKIAMTVAVAKEKGWNKAQTEAAIREILPVETKHRAELIARTELGKLNSRCVLATYEQTGVKYYKWLTTIDGRERESHAALNGKICSVENPDVYFDDNPDNPLKPIEHQRTGEMYHGHPGTDFQCRCTMVMWEPEIDSKYEIKEDHEREALEQEEAERKAREAEEERKRKEAEEKARAEMEEKARKKAEAKYKRELKKAEEAARKAQEAEEKARKAAEVANGAVRKAEILQKANERHAKRTEAQAQEIRERWAARHGEFNFIKFDPKIDEIKKPKDLLDYVSKKHGFNYDEKLKNCDFEKLKGSLKGIDAVIAAFPKAKIEDFNRFTSKKLLKPMAQAGFYSNFFGEGGFFVELENSFFKKGSAPFKDSDFHPKNNSAFSIACHEMGHVVNYTIQRLTFGRAKGYEDTAKQIVENAAVKMGKTTDYATILALRKSISTYADAGYKYTETIAESFSDIFANRQNASEFSKYVFNETKRYYEEAVKKVKNII